MGTSYSLHAHEGDTVNAEVVRNNGWLQIAVQPKEGGASNGATLFANPTGRAVVLAALCRDLATSVAGGKDVSDALLAAVEARATALPDWGGRVFERLVSILDHRPTVDEWNDETGPPVAYYFTDARQTWVVRCDRGCGVIDYGAVSESHALSRAMTHWSLIDHTKVATEVAAEIAPSAVTWEWHCNVCDTSEAGFETGEAAESCLQQHVGGVHAGERFGAGTDSPLVGSVHSSDGLTHVSVPS